MSIDKIKQFWNEQPVNAIAVAAMAITAIAKLIDSLSVAQGRRAYAKQVKHSTRRK